MKRIIDKRVTDLISVFYSLTVFILIIQGTDFFPFGYSLQNIRYIYIVLSLLFFLYCWKGMLEKKPAILLGILLLHTCLFGFVFINKTVYYETIDHFKEMIIYLLLIFLTFFFVRRQSNIYRFIRLNYYTISAVMICCLVVHYSDCVNPVYFINVLDRNHGLRSVFGFLHANFLGNILICNLLYSFFILKKLVMNGQVKEKNNFEIGLIIILDILMGEMLFSTQSRTSILAGVFFLFVYFFMILKEKISRKFRLVILYILLLVLIVFIFSGAVNTVWENSNRTGNVEINMTYFHMFSPWTGMGYIPSYGFLEKSYGFDTYALDIYYMYIFFTTGYIGFFIIAAYLILAYIYILKIKNSSLKCYAISLFLAILFTGLGSSHMITYQLAISWVNWTIIMILICSDV